MTARNKLTAAREALGRWASAGSLGGATTKEQARATGARA